MAPEQNSNKNKEKGKTLSSSIMDWFRPKDDKDLFDLSTNTFKTLDLDEVSLALNLKKKGVENGQIEYPPESDTQLDDPQSRVETLIQERITRIKVAMKRRLLSINQSIDGADTDQASLDTVVKGFKDELKGSREQFEDKLRETYSEAKSAQDEYKIFKKENNLNREADYSSKLSSSMVAIGVLLFEACMNMVFFAKSHPQGLVGGFFMAFAFAISDIGCLTFVGILARYKNSIKRKLKISGFLAGGFSLIWMIVYNLFVAHYREVSNKNSLNVDEEALNSFLTSPLGLELADSWVLFALGFLFSVIGFWSGYKLDDPYPLYGRKHRRQTQKREDLQKDYRECLSKLDEVAERWDEKIRVQAAESLNTFRIITNTIQEKENLFDFINTLLSLHEKWQRTLLQMYRDYNRQNRNTNCPAYFSEFPSIKAVPNIDAQTDQTRLADAQTKINETITERDQYQTQILDQKETARKQMGSFGKKLLDELPMEGEQDDAIR